MQEVSELKFSKKNKLTLEGRIITAISVGTPSILVVSINYGEAEKQKFLGEAKRYCPAGANAFVLSDSDIVNTAKTNPTYFKAIQYYHIVK